VGEKFTVNKFKPPLAPKNHCGGSLAVCENPDRKNKINKTL